MKIRRRCTLVIGGLVAATVVAYGFSLAWTQRRALSHEQERANLDSLQRLAVVCQESLFSRDEIMLVNYLKDLKRSPDVRWAMFVREDGRIAVHTDMSMKNSPAPPPFDAPAAEAPFVLRPGHGMAVYGVPITRRGQAAGVAWLAYDSKIQGLRERQALFESLARFGWVTFFCLAAGLAVAAWVARSLTVPIGNLADAVRRLGEGDWSVRLAPQGKDELARLAAGFNDMSGKLARLDQLKDDFVATVSHDLRNPLGAITMIAQYMRTARPSEEVRERMSANLFLSVQRLRSIVENNLDAAKIKEHGLELRNVPFSLDALLREVYDLFRIQADECGQSFALECGKLPQVRGDEEKTHRVVVNLVANAFKFTSAGDKITLKAAGEDDGVRVTIEDTGPGISADDMGRLFRRFRTADGAPAAVKKSQGAGLGLAIAKALVEGQGGRLWAESREGQGTSFHFTVPRRSR